MPLMPVRDLLYIIPVEPLLTTSKLIVAPETYVVEFKKEDGTIIELPQTTRRRPNQGIIKYRGPLTTDELVVGDHVLFSPFDGDEIIQTGEGRFIVIPEGDILARYDEGESGYMLTLSQVKERVQRSAERVAVSLGREYKSDEARRFLEHVSRLKEELDASFVEELYF
jgi:co-chaperonin GroES (HSP10)